MAHLRGRKAGGREGALAGGEEAGPGEETGDDASEAGAGGGVADVA